MENKAVDSCRLGREEIPMAIIEPLYSHHLSSQLVGVETLM